MPDLFYVNNKMSVTDNNVRPYVAKIARRVPRGANSYKTNTRYALTFSQNSLVVKQTKCNGIVTLH